MLASVWSATLLGVDGHLVSVEVHVSNGLPAYNMVGLPDAAGRESRERVRAALLSSDLPWPMRRVTVNLAQGGMRKSGAGFELAVALGLLLASAELPEGCLEGAGVLGELGLDGSIRTVPGTLALVDAFHRAGLRRVVVHADNAAEAALVAGIEVLPARSLGELRACLKCEHPWPQVDSAPPGARGVVKARPPTTTTTGSTSPMCAACTSYAAHSRSRSRVVIICCSSARRVSARRCGRAASRRSCRTFAPTRRSK